MSLIQLEGHIPWYQMQISQKTACIIIDVHEVCFHLTQLQSGFCFVPLAFLWHVDILNDVTFDNVLAINNLVETQTV